MHLAALAFLSLIASASPPPVLEPPAKAVTAWPCTVETLRTRRECVFESEGKPAEDRSAQKARNAATSKQLATALCASASRVPGRGVPNPPLARLCVKSLAEIQEPCAIGDAPLLDDEDRFAPAARDCYLALAAELDRIQVLAATAPPCCRCLARNGCAKSPDQCYEQLSSGSPSTALGPCLAQTCRSSCMTADDPQSERSDP